MEKNKETLSGYEYAYKKKSSTVDKRALRLHRRSIEWKNNRGDRLNSARKLESLSPLQELSNNTYQDESYDKKTPSKKSEAFKSSKLEVAKENSKATEQKLIRDKLAKWKEEKELKKKLVAREKAKSKPFKVSHIDYKELEKLDARIKATKATGQAKQEKPGTVKTFKAPVPPPSVPVYKKPVVPKATVNTRQSVPKPSNKTKPYMAAKTSTKPPASTTKAKTFQKPVQPAPLTRSKVLSNKGTVPTTKGPNRMAQNVREKNNLQIDLHKVSTSRGQSFAPEEFTFNAPSNLSSFVFRPLSPNAAASFLNPSQDAGASFIGTDPKRCSTPKSSDSVKNELKDVFDQESEQTFKGDIDETMKTDESVQVNNSQEPLRRSFRQRNGKKSETDASKLVRTRTRSQNKVETHEGAMETNKSRTGSVGFSQDRSRKLSQGKRTLDRSSSRRLSQGSVSHDTSINKPRNRSNKTKENTPTNVRSSSSKRLRVKSGDNLSDEESTSKRSKSFHVSPKQVPVKAHTNDIPKNKPVLDLEESLKDEAKSTPKRRSLRLSRKSLMNVEVTSDSSTQDYTQSTVDEVFKNKEVENKNKDNECNNEKTEEPVVEAETSKHATPSSPNRPSVRRSLQSKPTDLDNVSKPVVEMSPKSLQVQDPVEVNDENLPTKKITRSTKRRSMSSVEEFVKPNANTIVLSTKRTANKKKRRKSVYDHTIVKSPEEWIKVLQNSPMIEMNRRTTKQKTSPPPALDFDLDLEELEEYNPSKVLNFSNCDDGTSTSNVQIPDTQMETNDVHQIEQKSNPKKYAVQELQVDEVSTTQESDKSDENGKTEEHDVTYFRNLLQLETDRLNQLCQKWDDINTNTPDLTDDVRGQLRTVVGQGQLLVAQRFKQFRGLVDNCEFKQGEKETTCTDIQGFWEMIYFQVEDVNVKFGDLQKLQSSNWDLSTIQPKTKVIKKKTNTKPVIKKPAVKSKFAAFRAGIKNKTVVVTEDKTFDAGFFKVQSPVKNPSPHCAAGSPRHFIKKDVPEIKTDNIAENVQYTDNLQHDDIDKVLLTTPLITPLKRKSYLPNIPSPLLQDITPQRRPTRSSARRGTPLPKNILSDVDDNIIMETNVTNIAQDLAKNLSEQKSTSVVTEVARTMSENKPRRRSTRTRKSVSFCDSVTVPEREEEEKIEDQDPFSKYLQPMTPRMSMAPKGYSVLDAIPDDDSFTKKTETNYELTFSPDLKNTNHKDSPSTKSRSRHSSLKQLPTRERRRSSRKSVQFTSPKSENIHIQAVEDVLMTPPSNSVPSNTSTPDSSEGEIDRFSSLNIDYTPVVRSVRPSLLFTPPRREDTSLSVASNVPIAQLISFTP